MANFNGWNRESHLLFGIWRRQGHTRGITTGSEGSLRRKKPGWDALHTQGSTRIEAPLVFHDEMKNTIETNDLTVM